MIPADELESRIESLIGDFARSEAVYWGNLHGDEYVDVSLANDNAVHIDLDMIHWSCDW